MDITGKVALVTGGAKRIGKAIALALGRRGCRLVVHYHTSSAEAAATVQELRAGGCDAVAVQADLTQEEDIDRMIDAAVAHFGRIDILVNSAAVFFRTPIDSLTLNAWKLTLDTNLTATFLCSQKLGRKMRTWGRGHIINMADVAGQRPWADYLAYSVAKAGVIALTQGLALALAPEVRVNAVAPGPMLFLDDTPEEVRAREIRKTLLKRMGTPEDVAAMVVFLAESDYSTGALFHVDGGRALA